jgi:hypothetical protein
VLHIGDEWHNRNRAETSRVLQAITPPIIHTGPDQERAAQGIEFGREDLFANERVGE